MATFQAWNSAAKCIDNPLILRGRSARNDQPTREVAALARRVLGAAVTPTGSNIPAIPILLRSRR